MKLNTCSMCNHFAGKKCSILFKPLIQLYYSLYHNLTLAYLCIIINNLKQLILLSKPYGTMQV